jgi:hypothetical protein
MSNITLEIVGSPEIYKGGKDFRRQLEKHYCVEEHYENFSGPEYGDPAASILGFVFKISAGILAFLKQELIEEGGKLILRKALFDPLVRHLERLEGLNKDVICSTVAFHFNDIRIEMNYSRANHINAISLISAELVKNWQSLKGDNFGQVSFILTPVHRVGLDWELFKPERFATLEVFIHNWGLSYQSGQEAIYNVKTRNILLERWYT